MVQPPQETEQQLSHRRRGASSTGATTPEDRSVARVQQLGVAPVQQEVGPHDLVDGGDKLGGVCVPDADGSVPPESSLLSSLPSLLPSPDIRVRAISLTRRPDRWQPCEEHLRGVLPLSDVDFAMKPACDASRCKGKGVDEVEEMLNIKLFRDWVICETEDIVRAGGAEFEGLSEVAVHEKYMRWWRVWHNQRATEYVDFHCGHITLGEIGCALSHLELIEEGARDGVECLVVFEDDARPTPEAIPFLREEIASLPEAWDMIFLRSSLYDKMPETPVTERLNRAGHRKCTDAYAISLSGMRKIVSSGYRDCLFAIDDFFPALFSHHPRPDVRALACVTSIASDFRAFSFRDELKLSSVLLADTQRSDTNHSPCVIGDHGPAGDSSVDEGLYLAVEKELLDSGATSASFFDHDENSPWIQRFGQAGIAVRACLSGISVDNRCPQSPSCPDWAICVEAPLEIEHLRERDDMSAVTRFLVQAKTGFVARCPVQAQDILLELADLSGFKMDAERTRLWRDAADYNKDEIVCCKQYRHSEIEAEGKERRQVLIDHTNVLF